MQGLLADPGTANLGAAAAGKARREQARQRCLGVVPPHRLAPIGRLCGRRLPA